MLWITKSPDCSKWSIDPSNTQHTSAKRDYVSVNDFLYVQNDYGVGLFTFDLKSAARNFKRSLRANRMYRYETEAVIPNVIQRYTIEPLVRCQESNKPNVFVPLMLLGRPIFFLRYGKIRMLPPPE